ncbi:MAG: laccase domain-containing protein, partial [Planctomycetes bacterium]|nr:laccase domain-containing protein [Planctomycetota bacterium]
MGERGEGIRDGKAPGSARDADPASIRPDLPAPVPLEPFDRFPDLICAHSERAGGISEDPFRSLNLGLLTADDPHRVRENRRRWLAACGVAADRAVSPLQVHGGDCIRVTSADGGRGAIDIGSAPRADGLWTDASDLALLAVSADCALIALYEPERRIAAVVHAGWRGAAAGIAARAVEALAGAGARRERIWAGVGPAIGPCCYEV